MYDYTGDDRNQYGDVTTIREGWIQCSMMESRGAPRRETILAGWGGTRRYPKAIKNALVPAGWLTAKREKKQTRPRRTLADRLAALPASIRIACHSYHSHTCRRCEGYGLIYSDRVERDIRCATCRGEGRIHSRRIHGPSITAATRLLAMGGSEADAITAALTVNPAPTADESWDGTLTSTWERHGYVDQEQADRIREKVAYRHECTNYDELLAAGYSKEDARTAAC